MYALELIVTVIVRTDGLMVRILRMFFRTENVRVGNNTTTWCKVFL